MLLKRKSGITKLCKMRLYLTRKRKVGDVSIIPAKNREFAIAGATVWDFYIFECLSCLQISFVFLQKFSAHTGYSFEVAAHWISSYFQNFG